MLFCKLFPSLHVIDLCSQLQLGESDCPDLVMLTHNLLVTGGKVTSSILHFISLWLCFCLFLIVNLLLLQGFLTVWDARLTEPLKIVRLGHTDGTAALRMIRQVQIQIQIDEPMHLQVGDTVVCSFGSQIRLVRFPMLADKVD